MTPVFLFNRRYIHEYSQIETDNSMKLNASNYINCLHNVAILWKQLMHKICTYRGLKNRHKHYSVTCEVTSVPWSSGKTIPLFTGRSLISQHAITSKSTDTACNLARLGQWIFYYYRQIWPLFASPGVADSTTVKFLISVQLHFLTNNHQRYAWHSIMRMCGWFAIELSNGVS